MIWIFVIFPLVALALFFGRNLAIRGLARIPFRYTFNPANTFAIVVTEKNDVDNSLRGGNIKNVLHAIPGRRLVKPDPRDEMGWYFEKDDEPAHDNYLYQKLGVQDMGSFFYKLRTNVDKRERYARDSENPEEGLQTIAKKRETDHVFFTGEMQVPVNGADTADRIPLNFKLNLVFERKFPVRSVLRLADAPAFQVSQIEEIINRETSGKPIDAYYGGPDAKKNRKELADLIDDQLVSGDTDEGKAFKEAIERELGLEITEVVIRDVDVEERYKEALTAAGEAKKKMEAEKERVRQEAENIRTLANAQADATRAQVDADATRLEKIIIPAAANATTSEVFRSDRESEAYEKNKTITTLVLGGGSSILVNK